MLLDGLRQALRGMLDAFMLLVSPIHHDILVTRKPEMSAAYAFNLGQPCGGHVAVGHRSIPYTAPIICVRRDSPAGP